MKACISLSLALQPGGCAGADSDGHDFDRQNMRTSVWSVHVTVRMRSRVQSKFDFWVQAASVCVFLTR